MNTDEIEEAISRLADGISNAEYLKLRSMTGSAIYFGTKSVSDTHYAFWIGRWSASRIVQSTRTIMNQLLRVSRLTATREAT